eukprot:TRINITY_DN18058_c0_g1_i2.p1 TRINITY_DN18058_c0_g1~~TRINITY_DN18058_c0_g1_i2.p1  ORF type:complete len:305 (-),score=61.12 TRINITY_DN18058_c0_g1_i2:151-1065(-)
MSSGQRAAARLPHVDQAGRPQSASDRLRAQLRVARGNLPLDNEGLSGHYTSCRPQRGAGAVPTSTAACADAVGQLTRILERGEQPRVALLFECLQHICTLQVGATGGDSLLWMIGPVLQATRQQLSQENDYRQLLETEVAGMRSKADNLAFEAEHQISIQLRAEDKFGRQHREIQTKTEELLADVAHMQEEWEYLERQSAQLSEHDELSSARADWIQEQHTLESELESLEASILEFSKLTAELIEPQREIQEKVEQLRERLLELRPDAARQEHLRAALIRIEDEDILLTASFGHLDKSETDRRI